MDKSQLVTIAVTAATTVTAEEVLRWAVARAKKTALSDATKDKARKIFNKNNRRMALDGLMIAWSLGTLILLMFDASPITRFVILKICVMAASTVFWAVALLLGWILIQIKQAMKIP